MFLITVLTLFFANHVEVVTSVLLTLQAVTHMASSRPDISKEFLRMWLRTRCKLTFGLVYDDDIDKWLWAPAFEKRVSNSILPRWDELKRSDEPVFIRSVSLHLGPFNLAVYLDHGGLGMLQHHVEGKTADHWQDQANSKDFVGKVPALRIS